MRVRPARAIVPVSKSLRTKGGGSKMSTVLEKPAPAMKVDDAGLNDVRAAALESLKKKREFRNHLLAYVLVNSFLWLIWGIVYAVGGTSFPWPVFPMAGWGIGLFFHAWDVYRTKPFSEKQIRREIARLSSDLP
jgi:2TM domain-containing protein